MSRYGLVAQQYFDTSGDPLSGGKMNFYDPGTTNAKTVYSDEDETTPITQPVVLDGSGYQPDVFFTGQAKVVLTDADDVQIDVADPVGSVSATQFPLWESGTSYAADAIVQGSDGNLWISLSGSNSGNDPTSTSGFWGQVFYFTDYDAATTYNDGDYVISSLSLWKCNTNSTTAVTPSQAASQWDAIGLPASGGTVTGQITAPNVATTVYTITDGAAFEIDPANGQIQQVTLGDDRTPAFTNFDNGESVMLMVDDGTAYSITWPGTAKIAGDAPLSLSTTGFTAIVIWKAGGVLYLSRVGAML